MLNHYASEKVGYTKRLVRLRLFLRDRPGDHGHDETAVFCRFPEVRRVKPGSNRNTAVCSEELESKVTCSETVRVSYKYLKLATRD